MISAYLRHFRITYGRRQRLSVFRISGSVKTSISFDEVQALPNYYEDFVYAFVSEEVGFEGERKIIHLGAHDREDYRIVTASGIMDAYLPRNTAVIVVGTYEENEYCSGTDILVRLEDYKDLQRAFRHRRGFLF